MMRRAGALIRSKRYKCSFGQTGVILVPLVIDYVVEGYGNSDDGFETCTTVIDREYESKV